MKKTKCIHYHICINSYNLLCSDSKCGLVKQERTGEDQIRLEKVRQSIDEYKLSVGLDVEDNFSKLNIRR